MYMYSYLGKREYEAEKSGEQSLNNAKHLLNFS